MSNRQHGGQFTLSMEVLVDDTVIEKFLKDLNSSERVFGDILRERAKQDEQWGGPQHDDAHSAEDWERYLAYQLRAAERIAPGNIARTQTDEWRERMIKIAALAVAAVQSLDRKEQA